jgi:hypothetical protein
MWSKDGRFVEGLHAVGDIPTNISVNCDKFTFCIIIYVFIFMSFILCVVYNYLYIYGYCLYMLHVYVYCYFSMNPCIYKMYLSVYILYI